jgi:hypothetical protein
LGNTIIPFQQYGLQSTAKERTILQEVNRKALEECVPAPSKVHRPAIEEVLLLEELKKKAYNMHTNFRENLSNALQVLFHS